MQKEVKVSTSKKSKLRTQRIFSDTFKRQKVKDIEKGLASVTEISKLYKVSKQSIYRWLHKYSESHQKGEIQVVQMESESQKTKQLLKRLSELERIIGQKQLQIDYLEKLVEIGSEELNIDIKKNFGTKCCSISEASSSKKDLK